MSNLSRRSIVSSAAALPALAIPAALPAAASLNGSTAVSNDTDPIFAAIEAHRHARAETRAAYMRQADFEHKYQTDRDPRWTVLSDAAKRAHDTQDAWALDLLNIAPTTVAGAMALLSYYVKAAPTEDGQCFPDELADYEDAAGG